MLPTAVGAKEITSDYRLQTLSSPSGCGEVSAHRAVTSSSVAARATTCCFPCPVGTHPSGAVPRHGQRLPLV